MGVPIPQDSAVGLWGTVGYRKCEGGPKDAWVPKQRRIMAGKIMRAAKGTDR